MARSTDPVGARRAFSGALLGSIFTLTACGNGGPSKGDALDVVTRDVRPDAMCTLPITVLSQLKMQHGSKGMCVPKGSPTTPRVRACAEALAAAGVTKPLGAEYMRQWPDDVASKSLTDLPAYERRARELIYDACYTLDGDLREGRFLCGHAQPSKVLDVSKVDDAHFDVKYAQKIEPLANLGNIDVACDGVTKPPSDMTVRVEKQANGWSVVNASSSTVAH